MLGRAEAVAPWPLVVDVPVNISDKRVVVGLFLRLWTSLRPCRSSSSSPRGTFGWCLRSSSSTECFNLQYAAVACTHSASAVLGLYVPVVVQRQVRGRDSAENCRRSAVVAVSWTRWFTCPLCTSRVQTLRNNDFIAVFMAAGGVYVGF